MKKPLWIFIGITVIFVCILIGIFVGRRTAGAYIPVAEAQKAIAEDKAGFDGQIDINAATSAQLQLIPGIGPSIAQRIIDYRTENGNFTAIEDLLKIKGIGTKTFEQMKPYIKVITK